MPELVPPLPEYVRFTQRRAVWQALGRDVDTMSAREAIQTLAFLRAESEQERKRRGN